MRLETEEFLIELAGGSARERRAYRVIMVLDEALKQRETDARMAEAEATRFRRIAIDAYALAAEVVRLRVAERKERET